MKYEELERICQAVIDDKVSFLMAAMKRSKTMADFVDENQESLIETYQDFYANKYSSDQLKEVVKSGKYPMYAASSQRDLAINIKAYEIDERNNDDNSQNGFKEAVLAKMMQNKHNIANHKIFDSVLAQKM